MVMRAVFGPRAAGSPPLIYLFNRNTKLLPYTHQNILVKLQKVGFEFTV